VRVDFAVFEGGRYLGVPLTTLVAGVSVSGLTVALAAQDTLKNLFGSVMICSTDRFRLVTSFISRGMKAKSIGRIAFTTRIRDTNGHVISISNEEMARLDSKTSAAVATRAARVLGCGPIRHLQGPHSRPVHPWDSASARRSRRSAAAVKIAGGIR
jgi:hypothetical protein